ncbi:MAG TPA: DUF2332 domain-containing protein [Candidatus Dormibacteraeota bacterium]|nr:DUF2332 domain-containing protein [Candidatus Dormibacteraeota bacterium]
MPGRDEVLAVRLRFQAQGCAELGSPFYGSLLESAAADLEAGGAVLDVLAGFESEPEWSALALRLMGAVHRLVLQGRLAQLEPHYPSVGGDGDAAAAWPTFRDALREHRPEIRRLIGRGCQTNEVGRSAALLGGFLEVAHRTGLPLRLLEIGASAGLNLRWDRYRYESGKSGEPGEAGWGDENSAARFVHFFDVPPPLDRAAEVVERRGCDLEPIDPTTDEGSLALRSFIWADQLGRLTRLDGAIAIAQEMPVEVERLEAATFLERELATPRRGVATVVYHSVFIQYLSEEGQRRIADAIDNVKPHASTDAPIYHLRMEPDAGRFEIRLDHELLGTSQAHGTGVKWLAP